MPPATTRAAAISTCSGCCSRQALVPTRFTDTARRNRIEIMFGRLKDWRRVATRYDRCPKVFLSAIPSVATVMFWL
ncbi:transposase [Aliiruegeria sabulilitoris]|uniref:transposase n=1 Tax=Aliiruegeria sabulilitoris TaxID=1510458 RepID=UPI002F413BD0